MKASCARCGKEYNDYPSRILRHKNNYCTPECSSLHRAEQNIERFWSKAKLDPETGCLEWRHFTDPKGYGFTRYYGKNIGAHRLAWILTNGEIGDSNLFVCHHCDNPGCINPDHLFLGTIQDNTQDMINKGRAFWQKDDATVEE